MSYDHQEEGMEKDIGPFGDIENINMSECISAKIGEVMLPLGDHLTIQGISFAL